MSVLRMSPNSFIDVGSVPQHHNELSRPIAHVVVLPDDTELTFFMSDGTKAVVRTNVPLPSWPREFAPVHHTSASRTTHVCWLPAAGEEICGGFTTDGPGVVVADDAGLLTPKVMTERMSAVRERVFITITM